MGNIEREPDVVFYPDTSRGIDAHAIVDAVLREVREKTGISDENLRTSYIVAARDGRGISFLAREYVDIPHNGLPNETPDIAPSTQTVICFADDGADSLPSEVSGGADILNALIISEE